METKLAKLALFGVGVLPTKSNVQALVDKIATDEELSPTEAIVAIKFITEVMEGLKARIKAAVIAEAEKDKELQVMGARIRVVETGVTYDYSGDPVWIRMNEAIKARQELLKVLKKPMIEVDETTGEAIEVRPAIKSSTTSPQITLAK